MGDTNKVRFGLSNVHVGKVLSDETGNLVFSVPTPYPGAVNLTLDPEGETSTFYADNIAYYVTNKNNGYSGELEMAYLPDWFEIEYLGSNESEEGMIVETSDAKSTQSYMMFQFDGDKNATKYIIYNTTFGRSSVEGNTSEDTTEPNTTTIPFTSIPLVTEFGNIIRAKIPSTASTYDTLFTTAPTVPTKKAGAEKSARSSSK